jgi:hypothetical protein
MKTSARDRLIKEILKEMPPSFKDEYIKEYYLETLSIRGLRKELLYQKTANERIKKHENS